MSVKILPRSYLRFADLLTVNGIEFWDVPSFPDIPPQPDDTTFTVDDLTDGRIDTIAYKVYGDAQLWWVIALANGLDLLPTQLKRNMVLRIPSANFVFKKLLSQKKV